MEVNLSRRQNQLTQMETFLKDVDTEVTMILQSLQWDRKYLMETKALVSCQYDANHRVPPDKLLEHEKVCFLKSHGYSERDRLLPSPVDPTAATLIKLSSNEIDEIINYASVCQPVFNRVPIGTFGCERLYIIIIGALTKLEGAGCRGIQPLTLDRLQATYTSDERRAIHDAVVNLVPSCHDLSDLTLLSEKDEGQDSKPKSKLEILVELRNMKRRRTKYRVAAKTRNYSDVLRDVIHTQMELYTQTQENIMTHIKKEEETEDLKTSKDKYSSKYQSKYQRDERRSSDAGKDLYGCKSRKRRHKNENKSNKYARLKKSKNRKSDEKNYERNVESSKNYASDNREDKYARRKDDKEKHKRHHVKNYDHSREHQTKQSINIAPKDIKQEKIDSDEIIEDSKYESFTFAETSSRCNEKRQSCERGSSNKQTKSQNPNKHANNEQKRNNTVTIKKKVEDHDLHKSDNYETSKNYVKVKDTTGDCSEKYHLNRQMHRKELYVDNKSQSRDDRQRYISQEGERSVADKEMTINKRESGWSGDSGNGYPARRYDRAKNKYTNFNTENKYRNKNRLDKYEDKELRDNNEGYRHNDRRKNDCWDSQQHYRAENGNKKSSHFRRGTGAHRGFNRNQRQMR